jgi:hypothetical protein
MYIRERIEPAAGVTPAGYAILNLSAIATKPGTTGAEVDQSSTELLCLA